ncbi:MAG TPA: Gfo/Idh/MocA family oxidoreductase [Fimbriimonas sp.]|nr:Gfo/Idh/MocA family oxidoreductase [Fimbriimonas sp.]
MSAEIKVGVAGLTHGHVGGLINDWKKVGSARLAAVADSTRLLDGVEGFDRKYKDWQEMLETESLDALVITSDSLESSEIAVQALGKKIPCMVEKPMAANLADAERMLAAWKASGVALMINWPLAWSGWVDDFKKRIDEGQIGKPFHLRYRNGHSGPREIGCGPEFVAWLYDEKKNGGGAIGDFGSYGGAVAAYLFGLPEAVHCVRGNYTKDYEVSDDHSICLLQYPKASAILEGTWATAAFDSGPLAVVHGSEGTLAAWWDRSELTLRGNNREEFESTDVPGKGPAEYFLHCMQTGETPKGILNPEISADSCRILDAALRSTASGCGEKPK